MTNSQIHFDDFTELFFYVFFRFNLNVLNLLFAEILLQNIYHAA